MREERHPAFWVPPFLVGVVAAVAGELSVGLLLYATSGFLRSLTLVLAILLGSLALGLWTPPAESSRVEGLRRRWLLALLVFAGAAAVSGAWSARAGLATTAVDRGVGLAFLVGLPLYACGALLGAMTDPNDASATPSLSVAAPAAAGAAGGALLTGFVLVSALVPISIYSLCLLLISGGALVHGRVLSLEADRRVLASLPSRYGTVTVEERSAGRPRGRERILLENGRVRGAEDANGRPFRAWERGVLSWLSSRGRRLNQNDDDLPVLFLGGGALTVPRLLLAQQPDVRVRVVEPNAAVLEAARSHFAFPVDNARFSVHECSPYEALSDCEGPLETVVADAGALAPGRPVPDLGEALLAGFRQRMRGGGVLAVAGLEERVALGPPLEGLIADGSRAFEHVSVHSSSPGEGNGASELVVLFSTDEVAHGWEAAGWQRLGATLNSGSAAL